MFVEKFYDCLKHDGIVAVATASKDAKAHVVNTWNKYVIVTDDEKLLIPCYGFRKTERNIAENPYVEITLGSSDVMGYKGMGAGFLLIGTAEFQSSGPLFEEMHDKCDFANRVMVFTPEKCTQMI